jgi:exodeoxyribonuclease X
MSSLLFCDVEATGIDEEDRLLQLAYRHEETDRNEFFKPPLPIKLQAMAVHHVTEAMVANKPEFRGSPTFTEMVKLAAADAIFVAHNAKYDLTMLAKEGILFKRHICTMKIARYIDPGDRFENHQLQYLRYFYGIEIEAIAHDAFGDIIVLEAVFARLYQDFLSFEFPGQVVSEYEALTRMVEISAQPSLLTHIRFGKYSGKTIEEVAKLDKGYLEWLLGQKLVKPEGEEDWIYTLKHHLRT